VDQPYVDDELEPHPELNKITNAVIGAAIEVHRELGAGLLEVMYENALAIELRRRGIPFERQVPLAVYYKGEEMGNTRLDFIIAGCVVVELKAVESLAPVHKAQMICYLKVTKHKLGILINFNVPVLKDGIRRVAC
jgi:GxxExxY protein